MAYDVETKPGRWVREQTVRRERRILIGVGIGFLITGAFLAYALGRHISLAGSLAFLAAVALVRPYAEKHVDRHVRMRDGTKAEELVGETLNELRSEGWIAMHDIDRWGAPNIDHIASGPHGVYAIETKLRRYEDSDLGRIKHQARLLHDELDVWVTPVICLHLRRGKTFRHNGVSIVPHRDLLRWLRAQRNQPVEFERLARFADRL